MKAFGAWMAGALCALAAVGAPAAAQESYPARAVKIVALNPPGGVSDTLARVLGEGLGGLWGKPVVVENKVGAAGIIGSEQVRTAEPDGYTLLMAFVGNLSINPGLYKKLPYDSERDFAPVSLVGRSPLMLIAHPDLPVRNLDDLVRAAKRQPDAITYSSAGVGNGAHLAMELLQGMAGIRLFHIPYKGGPQAALAVASGEVQLSLTTIPTALPLIRSGQVRALAVTTAERLPAIEGLPEVTAIPTVAESGLDGYDVTTWFGVVAPAGTPAAIVGKLNRDIATVLGQERSRQQILNAGLIPESDTPEAFRELIAAETRRWKAVIEAQGVATQ